mgnify:CR=1 FL=1
MNRNIAIGSSVLFAGAVAFALAGPPAPLLDHILGLNGADSLQVAYTTTVVGGGAARTTTITLKKPSQARVETAESLIIADGTTITTYNKGDKTYSKAAQTDAALARLFEGVDARIWQPFFSEEALNAFTNVRSAGNVSRGGQQYKVVEAGWGRSTMKFYIGRDNVIRQAEIVDASGTRPVTTLLNVTTMSMGSAVPGDAFAFNPPAGSRELDLTALTGTWILEDLPKALEASKASGKLIMIDAYASWCGPCKLMDAQAFTHPTFKQLAKDFVLLKIDADIDEGFARRYRIEAFPTVVFVNGNGQEVHRFVGYGGPDAVFNEMKTALSKG